MKTDIYHIFHTEPLEFLKDCHVESVVTVDHHYQFTGLSCTSNRYVEQSQTVLVFASAKFIVFRVSYYYIYISFFKQKI